MTHPIRSVIATGSTGQGSAIFALKCGLTAHDFDVNFRGFDCSDHRTSRVHMTKRGARPPV